MKNEIVINELEDAIKSAKTSLEFYTKRNDELKTNMEIGNSKIDELLAKITALKAALKSLKG